jgi:hypothetical protein
MPSTLLVLTFLTLSGATGSASQEVLDRIVSRFNGQVVTISDLRQCRTLKLLTVSAESDEAYQRELENRLLILQEISRAGTGDPDAQAIAARRREWESSLGGGPALADRLARAGMSSEALDAWLANDVRIQIYLDERFRGTGSDQRSQALAHWISALRQRAGLR